MSSRCGSFISDSWLVKPTRSRKSWRHFSYIDPKIKLLSTNATVSKCQYLSIYPTASARMRATSKSMGCNAPEEWASLSRTSIFQCSNFHLWNTYIDTIDTTLLYPPLIGGASAGCVPPNSTYSVFPWLTSSPLTVVIPLPISCASLTTNCFAVLSLGTTLCGSE